MINTLAGSFTDMAQGTPLQSSIQSETNRATIISVSNAVDAAVSVIVLAVNGYISDHFGIGPAWISLAVVGLILQYLASKFEGEKNIQKPKLI